MLQTPVALIIFNRPQTTQRVFAEIARAKPRHLLIVADGPRTSEEAERCAAARAIINQVDWDCELLTDLADNNLGCKQRMFSGLNLAFTHYEDVIILEDDCLPQPSFFRFCAELLERYRHEPRVMAISGNNFLPPRLQRRMRDSYYFSQIPHIWGWASWRRVWELYDWEIKRWPALRATDWLARRSRNPHFKTYWEHVFDESFRRETNAWDFQLTFTCLLHEGLSAMPRVNLVSNIGFGDDATHTKDTQSLFANWPVGELQFPLNHPTKLEHNVAADEFTFRQNFLGQSEPPPLWQRALNKARRLLQTSSAKIS